MQTIDLDYVLKYLEDNFGGGEMLQFMDEAVKRGEVDEEK